MTSNASSCRHLERYGWHWQQAVLFWGVQLWRAPSAQALRIHTHTQSAPLAFLFLAHGFRANLTRNDTRERERKIEKDYGWGEFCSENHRLASRREDPKRRISGFSTCSLHLATSVTNVCNEQQFTSCKSPNPPGILSPFRFPSNTPLFAVAVAATGIRTIGPDLPSPRAREENHGLSLSFCLVLAVCNSIQK